MFEYMSDRMPNRMFEYMSDRMPSRMSEYVSDRIAVGGDHSKTVPLFFSVVAVWISMEGLGEMQTQIDIRLIDGEVLLIFFSHEGENGLTNWVFFAGYWSLDMWLASVCRKWVRNIDIVIEDRYDNFCKYLTHCCCLSPCFSPHMQQCVRYSLVNRAFLG